MAKALPDVIDNYNNTLHRSIKATPNEVWEGENKNPIERKVVESVMKKGDRVRIKHERGKFEKGDIRTFSKEIYKIVAKKGKMNTLQNLDTGETLKRLFHDDELSQTFAEPEKKTLSQKQEKKTEGLNPKEMIAQRKDHRIIKKPTWLYL